MRHKGNSVLTSDKGKSLSLPNLYIALFGDSYTAHDAFEDVQALYKVLFKSQLHVTTEHILSHSCTVKSFIKRMKFDCETKKRNQTFKGTLAPKRYNDKRQHKDREITSEMAHKMAESGLAYEDLKEVYKKEGVQGLERVLKQEREDGKPRVTKHKRVINTIVNHFQFQEEHNERAYTCKLQEKHNGLEQSLDQVQMLVDSTPCSTYCFDKCQSKYIQPGMAKWQVKERDKLHVKKSDDLKYEDVREKSKVELDYYKEHEEPDYYEEDEEPESNYYDEDEEPDPEYYEDEEEPEPEYYEEDEEPESNYYDEDEEPDPEYYEDEVEPEIEYYEEDEEPEPEYYEEDEEPDPDYYEDEEPEPEYYEEDEEPEAEYYEDEETEPNYYEEDEEPEPEYYEDEEPELDYYEEDEESEPEYYEDEEPEPNYYEDKEPEHDYYEKNEEPEPDYYEEDEEPEPYYYKDEDTCNIL